MHREYFKWVVTLALVSVAIITLFMWDHSPKQVSIQNLTTSRPFSPYKSSISAVGIVEATGGNVYIGSPVNRLVDKVEVVVGQKVKAGDVLFRLDSLDLQADLAARVVDYENAKANLNKLESLPRKEDVLAAKAQLDIAENGFLQAKSQYERVKGLNSGAMSQEEILHRYYTLKELEAKHQQIKADFDKIVAGAWMPDIEIARLQVKQTLALIQRVKTDIARTIIHAPSSATVLQVKILLGEFPPSDSSHSPAMIIGNTDTLNLRVNINQYDASYYNSGAPAIAHLQGNPKIDFPLHFMNIEPFFVAKQNLNNDISEKIDTRVLQVIYCFEEGENRVFVGQQMDVFIETDQSIAKGGVQ